MSRLVEVTIVRTDRGWDVLRKHETGGDRVSAADLADAFLALVRAYDVRGEPWSSPSRSRSLERDAGSFEEAWARKEAEGYAYGPEALENVRFGWELHEEAVREAAFRAWRVRPNEPSED